MRPSPLRTPALTLVVADTGGCALLQAGDRWVILGREVRAMARARLCLSALAGLGPALAELRPERSASELALERLRCGAGGCDAVFRVEPLPERRREQGPPHGVERRIERRAAPGASEAMAERALLAELPAAVAERLRERGRVVSYAGGETLLPEGAYNDCLFVVESGTVEVTRRSPRDGSLAVLAVLGPGECFGQVSLLTAAPTGARVVARGDARVLAVERSRLEALLDSAPELGRALSRLLAERLRLLNAYLEHEVQRGIAGPLAAMPVIDLVQMLYNSRMSGTLVLAGPQQEGRLAFRCGNAVSARLGAIEGEDAFHALLGWAEGDFRFEPGEIATSSDAEIEGDTLALVLESMRRIDEERG